MARVTVDRQALSDPRFRILGSHLQPLTRGTAEDVERAYGLWVCIRVWDYCTERGLLVVNARDLDAIHEGLADAMIDAELCARVGQKRAQKLRIKGGEGRLDWLDRKRKEGAKGAEFGVRGAEFGKLGGRPKKTPLAPVLETPARGDTKTPPPAPAPAPAQKKETTTSVSADADQVAASVVFDPKAAWETKAFERFWEKYPRKVAKQTARKAWAKIRNGEKNRDELTILFQFIVDRLAEFTTDEWADRPMDKIPHPSTWLNSEDFHETAL